MTIYTAGYMKTKLEGLLALCENVDAIVVDVRYKPSSRNPRYRQAFLQKFFGGRYHWLQEFGNANYRSGPIWISDFGSGVARVTPLMQDRGAAVLLCGCKDAAICHRTHVAKKLAKALGAVHVELGPLDDEAQLDLI